MAKITIIGRTHLGGEQPYGEVIWDGDKIVPHVLVVKGENVFTLDITYYLRYTRQGKQKVENVGTVLADVYQRRRVVEATLSAEANGLVVNQGVAVTPAPTVVPMVGSPTITKAVEEYIEGLRVSRRPFKSIQAKTRAMNVFMAVNNQVSRLSEFRREHVLAYKLFLEREGYAAKTIENRMMTAVTFFNEYVGKDHLGMKKEDWPVYRENSPEPYTDQEMVALLGNAGEHGAMIRLFVATGIRLMELAHLTKADIDARNKTVRIQPKSCAQCADCISQGNKWSPKTDEGIRNIPIGETLLKDLLARPGNGLLFPDKNGKVWDHILRDVIQVVAQRAGVACPKAHRFRDTFITNKIRDGVDIRTVQRWAGHTDINVTMGYTAWLNEQSGAARVAADREDSRYAVA